MRGRAENLKFFNARIIPCALLFLISGIVTGFFLSPLALSIFLLTAAICLSVYIILYSKYRFVAVLALFFIIAGAALPLIFVSNLSINSVTESNARITGNVSIMTMHEPGGTVPAGGGRIFIENVVIEDAAANRRIKGAVRVNLPPHSPQFSIGDRITLYGDLVPIEFEAGSAQSAARARNGVAHHFSASAVIDIVPARANFTSRIRIATRLALHNNTNPNTADFIYALLFGERGYLDAGDAEDFRQIGIGHLFAVSGMHIAALAGAVMLGLKFLKAPPRVRAGITLGVLAAYASLTGFTPSVQRAVLMFSIWQFARLFNVRHDGITAISFAALILLIIRPYYIFNLSFLMSFFAVIGINFNAVRIERGLHFLPKSIARAVSLSLSVNIAIFPIVMHYFGFVSLLFLPANLIILPVVILILPFIIFAALLAAFIPAMGFLIFAIGFIMFGIAVFSAALASLPIRHIEFELGWIAILPYTAALVITSKYCLLKTRAKISIAAVFLIIFAAIVALTVTGVLQ